MGIANDIASMFVMGRNMRLQEQRAEMERQAQAQQETRTQAMHERDLALRGIQVEQAQASAAVSAQEQARKQIEFVRQAELGKMKALTSILPRVKQNPALWPQAREVMGKLGINTSDLPEQADPQHMDALMQGTQGMMAMLSDPPKVEATTMRAIGELWGGGAEMVPEVFADPNKRGQLFAKIGELEAKPKEGMDPQGELREYILASGDRPGAPGFLGRFNRYRLEGKRAGAATTNLALGKPVGESTVKDIGEYGTAIESLKNIKALWQKEYGDNTLVDAAANYFREQIPGTKENVYSARKTLVTQLAGRLLEGGVLKEAEYSRYVKMIPGPSDVGKAGEAKWESIITGLESALASRNRALESAGYRTVTPTSEAPVDLSQMSDEDLARIAGGQ